MQEKKTPTCEECGRQEVVYSTFGYSLRALGLAGKYCTTCLHKRLRKEDDDLPPVP